MRILWQSTSPECLSGYGVMTRELIRRFKVAGHFIRVATKHAYTPWKTWEGIELCEGTNIDLLNDMLKEEKFDCLFALWDIWLLRPQAFPKEKYVAYVPIDTEWISELLTDRTKDSGMQIAMTLHGKRELESIGLKPMYAPAGVDTQVFKPDREKRKAFRDSFGWTDDNFIIGLVGMNYSTDRKGIIPLLRAFKDFRAEHDNAYLYVHCHWEGKYGGTVNYRQIAANLGIDKYVTVPHQGFNDLGRIDENWLSDIYNGFDVFCLPSSGEGFGLPLIEAQSCGIPVVTTRTTSGPELCKTGWLIDVTDDDLVWNGNGCWFHRPRPSAILKQLEASYNFWQTSDYADMKREAREGILEYDWNTIWQRYWIPVIGEMERRTGHDGITLSQAANV